MKQLYIIEYESAHWCGGTSHCVAWAICEDEAEEIAGSFMDEHMRELFSSEYGDEEMQYDDGQAHSVNFVETLETSEFKQFYDMPDQRQAFYPCVNEQDAA